jgi:hypothetical protein
MGDARSTERDEAPRDRVEMLIAARAGDRARVASLLARRPDLAQLSEPAAGAEAE